MPFRYFKLRNIGVLRNKYFFMTKISLYKNTSFVKIYSNYFVDTKEKECFFMAKTKIKSNSKKSRKTSAFTNETRTRIIIGLVYPESAPITWKQDLLNDKTVVSLIISPLHCDDTYSEKDLHDIQEKETLMNDGTKQMILWGYDKNNNLHYVGELKKPHHHIIVRRNSAYKVAYWKNMLQTITGCGLVEPCVDFGAMVRYLVHYDDTDKFHYDVDMIETYGTNKNISLYFEEKQMSSGDFYKLLKNLVDENEFTEFYELDNFIYNDSNDKWLCDMFQRNQSVRNHIDRYINSKRNAMQRKEVTNIRNNFKVVPLRPTMDLKKIEEM